MLSRISFMLHSAPSRHVLFSGCDGITLYPVAFFVVGLKHRARNVGTYSTQDIIRLKYLIGVALILTFPAHYLLALFAPDIQGRI